MIRFKRSGPSPNAPGWVTFNVRTEDADRAASALATESLTEERARELFNEWYDQQPMPQLLAQVDPQQAAYNAFEFGRSLPDARSDTPIETTE